MIHATDLDENDELFDLAEKRRGDTLLDPEVEEIVVGILNTCPGLIPKEKIH